MALLGKPLKGEASAGGGGGGESSQQRGRPAPGSQAEREYMEKLAKEDLQQRLAAATRKQLKVEAAWLKILRLAKIDSLRRDAEVLAQSHEREVDRRDALLQLLDADLDSAEEQFQQAVRDHLRATDKLVDLQDERLNDLERSFRAELAATEEEFGRERRELEASHSEEVSLVRATLAAVREREERQADLDRASQDQKREELRNDASDRMEELARTMDDSISSLERAFEAAHVDYLSRTDSMAEKFKQMTAKDQRDLRTIRDYVGREHRLQAHLTATRAKLVSAARDFGERNAALTKERESMVRHVAELKRRMGRAHRLCQARLSSLSNACTTCKAQLANKIAVAERILLLNERCRELETPEEKVLPFFTASDDDPVTGAPSGAGAAGLVPARDGPAMDVDAAAAGAKAPPPASGAAGKDRGRATAASAEDTRAGEEGDAGADGGGGGGGGASGAGAGLASLVTAAWPEMAAELVSSGRVELLELFHRRHNKVLAERIALEAERARLKSENATLARMVKATLEGISLPEGLLEGDNPLLVINGRAGVTAEPSGGAPTIVDGPATMRVAKLTAARRG